MGKTRQQRLDESGCICSPKVIPAKQRDKDCEGEFCVAPATIALADGTKLCADCFDVHTGWGLRCDGCCCKPKYISRAGRFSFCMEMLSENCRGTQLAAFVLADGTKICMDCFDMHADWGRGCDGSHRAKEETKQEPPKEESCDDGCKFRQLYPLEPLRRVEAGPGKFKMLCRSCCNRWYESQRSSS